MRQRNSAFLFPQSDSVWFFLKSDIHAIYMSNLGQKYDLYVLPESNRGETEIIRYTLHVLNVVNPVVQVAAMRNNISPPERSRGGEGDSLLPC